MQQAGERKKTVASDAACNFLNTWTLESERERERERFLLCIINNLQVPNV